MTSVLTQKVIKLSDYVVMEDGSYLVPIICNITHKDQKEQSKNLEALSQPKKLNELDEFLRHENINHKYKWNNVNSSNHDSGSANLKDLNADLFIYSMLNKCKNFSEIIKTCTNLLNINLNQRITLETNFYDKTQGSSKTCALNVSVRLLSPIPQPKKRIFKKKAKTIEDTFKPTKRQETKTTENKTKKVVSTKSKVLDKANDAEFDKKRKSQSTSKETIKDVEIPKIKSKNKGTLKLNSSVNHKEKDSLEEMIDNSAKSKKLQPDQKIDKIKEKKVPKKVPCKHALNDSDQDNDEMKMFVNVSDPKGKKVKKDVGASNSAKLKHKETSVTNTKTAEDISQRNQLLDDKSICEICGRKFASERGKKQHLRIAH